MDTRQDGGRLEKSESAFRTISEVASELDIPQHVLRFWEGKFPQIKPLKRAGGRRYYRPEDVALLRRIRDLLYGEGYTIKGVQKLLREGGVRTIITPPVVEMGDGLELEDAPADIIEEDDTDEGTVEITVPATSIDVISTDIEDDRPAVEENVTEVEVEVESEVEVDPVDVTSPAEDDTPPQRIALESVLGATPDEALDLFPVIEEEQSHTPDDAVAMDAVDDATIEDNETAFEAEEGDNLDLLQPLQVEAMDVVPQNEDAFPVVDLSSPLDTAGDDLCLTEGEADTVVVDRAALHAILSELEALRSMLRGGGQSGYA